jgi:hypothetical protein
MMIQILIITLIIAIFFAIMQTTYQQGKDIIDYFNDEE